MERRASFLETLYLWRYINRSVYELWKKKLNSLLWRLGEPSLHNLIFRWIVPLKQQRNVLVKISLVTKKNRDERAKRAFSPKMPRSGLCSLNQMSSFNYYSQRKKSDYLLGLSQKTPIPKIEKIFLIYGKPWTFVERLRSQINNKRNKVRSQNLFFFMIDDYRVRQKWPTYIMVYV